MEWKYFDDVEVSGGGSWSMIKFNSFIYAILFNANKIFILLRARFRQNQNHNCIKIYVVNMEKMHRIFIKKSKFLVIPIRMVKLFFFFKKNQKSLSKYNSIE